MNLMKVRIFSGVRMTRETDGDRKNSAGAISRNSADAQAGRIDDADDQRAAEEGKDRKRDIYRYQRDKKHNDKHDEEE